jgi:hypothetical protein
MVAHHVMNYHVCSLRYTLRDEKKFIIEHAWLGFHDYQAWLRMKASVNIPEVPHITDTWEVKK